MPPYTISVLVVILLALCVLDATLTLRRSSRRGPLDWSNATGETPTHKVLVPPRAIDQSEWVSGPRGD